jgi:hypothetical protein
LGKEFSEDIQDGAYVSTAISRIVQKSSAGLRFSVAHAFPFRRCWIPWGAGETLDEFLDDFPTVSKDDAEAALGFAQTRI